MDEMQSKLNAILGDPQMMQQIMSMAQAMNQQSQETASQAESASPPPKQDVPTVSAISQLPDAAMLQRIAGLARQAGVDKNQQALLRALAPYLSRERISKLEKAMRAAKIAGVAATALGGGGLSLLSGR